MEVINEPDYYHLNAAIMNSISKKNQEDIGPILKLIQKKAEMGLFEIIIINNIDNVVIHYDTREKLIKLGYKVTSRYAQPYLTKDSRNDAQELMLTINWT